jgi:small subunit ribosomal protein S8
MLVDPLADALNTIKVHEMVGQHECTVRGTKFVGKVLDIMKRTGYIADYKLVEDGVKKKYHVKLSGAINNCGVIKPRYAVKRSELSSYEERYIPAVGIGVLVVSTPKGLMTNTDAENQKIGGRLVAYFY